MDKGILGRKRETMKIDVLEQHGGKEVVQLKRLTSELTTPTTEETIGSYREYAIAIESEAGDSLT